VAHADVIPEFLILPKRDVNALLESDAGAAVRAIVSIGDPEESPPRCLRLRPAKVLRLEFDDFVFYDTPTAEDLDEVTLPTREQIARLIAFSIAVEEGTVLFHCFAGISRSTAAATVFCAARTGPGHEREAFERVLAARRQAHPNLHMLEHADAILNTNLVGAFRSIFKQQPAIDALLSV